jgi:hypothetical protein
VFHHPTPGWGGEILTLLLFVVGDEQNDEDSTNGGCFCVCMLHMGKLKGGRVLSAFPFKHAPCKIRLFLSRSSGATNIAIIMKNYLTKELYSRHLHLLI